MLGMQRCGHSATLGRQVAQAGGFLHGGENDPGAFGFASELSQNVDSARSVASQRRPIAFHFPLR